MVVHCISPRAASPAARRSAGTPWARRSARRRCRRRHARLGQQITGWPPRGHNKAATRPDSERLRADARKTPLQGRRQGFRVPSVRDQKTGPAADEPLIGSQTAADVPLTGLSFDGVPRPERDDFTRSAAVACGCDGGRRRRGFQPAVHARHCAKRVEPTRSFPCRNTIRLVTE